MTPAEYAGLSNLMMDGAIVVYTLAILAYAGEMLTARISSAPAATRRRVLVGTAGAEHTEPAEDSTADDSVATKAAGAATPEPLPADGDQERDRSAVLGRVAVAVTVVGWLVHATEILTRGLAVGRWPWGNMYEFTSTLCFAAVTAFLVLLWRYHARFLGMYVLGLVVLGLGLDGAVLYESAGPLVPALQSYWIAIHVSAATLAIGLFAVGTVVSGLYLVAERYAKQTEAGAEVGLSGLARRLPRPHVLDALAYRVIAVGFPIWTFAIVAGAIWAEAAWGRYWGWDPKETWSFIIWVIYACYLHARVTAGWRGRRAAMIALLAFAAILVNYFVVNIWIVGFHSYA